MIITFNITNNNNSEKISILILSNTYNINYKSLPVYISKYMQNTNEI